MLLRTKVRAPEILKSSGARSDPHPLLRSPAARILQLGGAMYFARQASRSAALLLLGLRRSAGWRSTRTATALRRSTARPAAARARARFCSARRGRAARCRARSHPEMRVDTLTPGKLRDVRPVALIE